MEEVQLLVKAVTLYPAGTVKRWETIAKYVNTHSGEGSSEKTAKQVISKVKTLQKLEGEEKTTQNKMAFSRFEQQHALKEKAKGQGAEATPTKRYSTVLLLIHNEV
jgi:DnaJ family protein C protein 2